MLTLLRLFFFDELLVDVVLELMLTYIERFVNFFLIYSKKKLVIHARAMFTGHEHFWTQCTWGLCTCTGIVECCGLREVWKQFPCTCTSPTCTVFKSPWWQSLIKWIHDLPDETNWSEFDMYLIWKFDRYLVCISIGIWVKLRSKTSIFPDQIFFLHIKLQSNYFFVNISPYFDTKIWYEFYMKILKSIWYQFLQSKKRVFFKKLFFHFFLKSRGWCGHLYSIPTATTHTTTIV
jgi:hypothetical protein